MLSKFKRYLIGKPLTSEQLKHEKFNVLTGLSLLSSDAISSVAYASEEILWILVPLIGVLSYTYMFYLSIAIIILLFILVFSYRQTIDSYPNGGGSYIVAKDNLGTVAGLVAGASLTIDYILTVAVSASAGTSAITSAIPSLLPFKVIITLIFIWIMAVGNLRGLSESAKLFTAPTYLFIATMFIMIGYGIIKIKFLGYVPIKATLSYATTDISILMILRAFAGGCTALTGVEAISNGVPNFKEPHQENAKRVLFFLGLIIVIVFGGMSYLATLYQAVPNLDKTIISQIASQVFGNNFMFYLVQITTTLILILAANTSFSDLPLLLSVIARDGFAPRQFTARGDRLSYSNGIIVLCFISSILVVIFKGEAHYLLPLYAVGVFTSFTLSQTGMFVKWVKNKPSGWIHKAFFNGLGAIVTFVTALIIGYTKFIHGAWIVCILIPCFVYIMLKIKSHYIDTANQLSMEGQALKLPDSEKVKHFIIPIGGVNKSVLKTLNYAKCLSKDIVAFHISVNDEETEIIQKKWKQYKIDIPLIIRKSPYREVIGPLMEYIHSDEYPSKQDDIVTIVIPQFVVSAWWGNILHNHTALFLKSNLLKNKNIAVITVPYVIQHHHININDSFSKK
ncbi:APC family permease [Clostridium uliginosum]|uniref:Amino acid transporter n=1 Tax=Clostridium uliginosum TaxID=119641 RepID=A0A1I1LTQ0_9CLOT|nr:APC family permease [Clostridium uliginosum]SFC76306.1 Amino acid transporter [Clostridium uliginosum]